MSRDEETGEPRSAAPGPAPHFSVVIAADGSAAIDGTPVAVAEGTVDAAILDTLHGYASERDGPVTAAISDPAVADVTFVEVSPDGSSRIVEGPPGAAQQESTSDEAPSVTPTGVEGELGEVSYALPESSRPSTAAPVPLPRRPRADAASEARQSDDEYRAPGLLHRPLVVGPVALGVAALVIVPLALLGSGGSGGGQDRSAGVSDELGESSASRRPTSTPTVSVSPSMPPSSPSASATAKPEPKDGTTGEGVTATVTVRPPRETETVTAEPAPETAATAVNRLARNDPGRHICYRAYVSGRGWQKPVCDGTAAGTTGQDRAVKALNIAVRGTGGVAANAFVHNPSSTDGQGVWMPHWTANTDDGKDIYIGSAKKGAPNMLGFVVNIGSGGQICQLAEVRNSGWGRQGCVGPRPDYVFGGTLSNDLWLEAVKLTV